MNTSAALFKIDSVRRIDREIDYFGEAFTAAVSQDPAEPKSCSHSRFRLSAPPNRAAMRRRPNDGGRRAMSNSRRRTSVMRKPLRAIAALGVMVVFTLDWSVESAPNPTIRGYVVNHDGAHAEPVRVLAQAIDESGAVVAKRIAWVPGGVLGFSRAYFEILGVPAAARYRITVWDYNGIQS